MMQGMNGTHDIRWLTIMMLIHFVFTLFSLSSGLPGGSFIPTLVTGGLLGQIFGLVLVQRGWIGYENVSYMMLIGMVAFFGGCGAYPFDCHCSDNGDYRSFRGVLSFHRGRWVDLLFHRIVTDKTLQCIAV